MVQDVEAVPNLYPVCEPRASFLTRQATVLVRWEELVERLRSDGV